MLLLIGLSTSRLLLKVQNLKSCYYILREEFGTNRHLHYCSLQQNPHHGSLESPGIFCYTNLTRIKSKIVMSFEDVELLKYSSSANSFHLWSSPVDLGTNSIYRVRLVLNNFFWNRIKIYFAFYYFESCDFLYFMLIFYCRVTFQLPYPP